jgi:hypothetical protein
MRSAPISTAQTNQQITGVFLTFRALRLSRFSIALGRTGRFCNRHLDADRRSEPAGS